MEAVWKQRKAWSPLVGDLCPKKSVRDPYKGGEGGGGWEWGDGVKSNWNLRYLQLGALKFDELQLESEMPPSSEEDRSSMSLSLRRAGSWETTVISLIISFCWKSVNCLGVTELWFKHKSLFSPILCYLTRISSQVILTVVGVKLLMLSSQLAQTSPWQQRFLAQLSKLRSQIEKDDIGVSCFWRLCKETTH